jgi:hypothetical protein
VKAAASEGLAKWRLPALAIVALAGVLAVAFSKCDRGSSPNQSAAVVEGLVAAPEGLLCDLYVAAPNASWTKLQRGIGGAVGILPATLPGLVVALLDLDVALSNELDGTSPMYGAVAGDPADPGLAIAMKLVDARRARGLLAERGGDTARYTAKEAPGGMTLLLPSANRAGASGSETDRQFAFALAITKNGYLLVSRRSDDLGRLGPYVTRTIPARPAPQTSVALDVPRSALQTQLKPRLEAFWKDGKSFLLGEDKRMRAERGRAPDFGDPAAIVAALDSILARRVAIMGDLEHIRVAVDITDDAAIATATLTPVSDPANQARKWVDGLKLGDASAVLGLPATSALALSTRDGEAERAEQAKAFEQAVASSLGSRLKDPERLHDVVDSATKARDEVVALAFAHDDPSGLVVRAPVRDVEAANRAIRGAFDLARAEPFKDLLHVKNVTSASEELPGLGKVDLLTMSRIVMCPPGQSEGLSRPPTRDAGAPAAATKSSDVGVAWVVDQKTIALAAGSEPLVTLKLGTKDRKLGDEPALKRFVTSLSSDASTVLIVQPLRLDPKRANLPAAPIGIALGRKDGSAFVRFDVSDGLLREAARWQMGF